MAEPPSGPAHRAVLAAHRPPIQSRLADGPKAGGQPGLQTLHRGLALAVSALALAATLAACYPAQRPERFTSEPLVPTIPAPPALPPLLASHSPATGAARPEPLNPGAVVTPSPQPATPVAAPPATAVTAPAKAASDAAPTIAPSPFDPAASRASGPAATPAGTARPPTTWGLPASSRGRVGVGATVFGSIGYDWGTAPPGWWLNWSIEPQPPLRDDIPFARLIFTKGTAYIPSVARIRATVAAHPGSLWLIGNEPDVVWQGNATPEQYAVTYHDLYALLKEVDPAAAIAIGGVSQPTPLRLAYLERVLAAYAARYGAPMPVDIWNVHAFILREELDSWGVGIPPGMEATQGTLYEISDHADLAIFRQQIVDFRRWLAAQGQREKPLIVSEYGILMPEDYGFPPDLVRQFMIASFDYFLTARDPDLGYSADDNRLVQAFCWYSTSDTVYPTSNLFDPTTRAITPLGEAFRQYVSGLP